MNRKSRQSLREAKDKRMKKIAIGGFVALVAVLAFEVPHMLKHGGSSPSASPTTTAATGTTTPTATPTPSPTATPATASLPTASTQLPNSEVAPRRTKSQLYSFNHFAGKDPFVQQVGDSTATTPSSPTSTPGNNTSITTTAADIGGNATTGSGSQQSRTLAGAGTATISINGKVQTVRVGGSFPSSNPLFTLVSIAHGVARIGIANGSYASGAQTVSLAAGHSLTLADTADGIRYKLQLLSAS